MPRGPQISLAMSRFSSNLIGRATSFSADIDECDEKTHNCSQISQVCKNATPGFKCLCKPGYNINEDSICMGKLFFDRMS